MGGPRSATRSSQLLSAIESEPWPDEHATGILAPPDLNLGPILVSYWSAIYESWQRSTIELTMGLVSHILEYAQPHPQYALCRVRHGTQRICALPHPVEQGHWCPLAPASQLCGCDVRLFQYFTIRWAWQQILRPLLLCCDIFRDNFHIPASECVMGYCGGSHICGPMHTGCSRYQSCRRPG